MLYTKCGDGGFSSIADGKQILKDDVLFEVLGNLDELNCILGAATLGCIDEHSILKGIQKQIIDVSAEIAGYVKGFDYLLHTREFECIIDEYEKKYKLPNKIILPCSTKSASYFQIARTVCRRCERSVVCYVQKYNPEFKSGITEYINRMSDLMFAIAIKYERI